MSLKPYYEEDGIVLYCGDNCQILPFFPDNSFDACVTDPPYGFKFMGKKWDCEVPSVETWQEVLRVLKPGAHCLACFGTRTYHRGVVALEDAGFEIRDCIMWVYGQGFPKSLDVSKALDRQAGAVREVIGVDTNGTGLSPNKLFNHGRGDTNRGFANGDGKVFDITAPATDAAKQWQGWGTALKPAVEMIVLARKPLSEKTVAENVRRWGTGAMNIDGSRVGVREKERTTDPKTTSRVYKEMDCPGGKLLPPGRFPANFIHDGSDEVVGLFPVTTSGSKNKRYENDPQSIFRGLGKCYQQYVANTGSAARFFYSAKANKSDRGEGNTHPTVKPTDLMRYLLTLVTPPGGRVLDPFGGSGTTAVAARKYNLPIEVVLIEQEETSCEIAANRLRSMAPQQLPLVGAA